jgi:hypothetical protein
MKRREYNKDMIKKPLPPRIHVLLSRDGSTGLILRRGPTKQFCTIGWDRINDRFQVGQWLKGVIYEERCDLSPNGKYFIYFAMKDGKPYTAISIAPYLKAVGFWLESDTWGGGGYFMDNSRVVTTTHLHGLNEISVRQERIQVVGNEKHVTSYWMTSVHYERLLRDGWVVKESNRKTGTLLEKPLPFGWALQKLVGSELEENQIINSTRNLVMKHPEWEWADYDGRRLMYVSEGVLYTAKIDKSGLFVVKLLHDFNNMVFEEIIAPY